MQLTKMYWVRDGATGLGHRPSARRDYPVASIGPKSSLARTIGLPNLLAVGNLDRGWLVALVWTLGTTRADGESKMMARFGAILYWCSLATAFMCGIAALTILAAIVTNKLSGEAWMAVVFFAAAGCWAWVAGWTAR
jgi:hypothetical protein